MPVFFCFVFFLGEGGYLFFKSTFRGVMTFFFSLERVRMFCFAF